MSPTLSVCWTCLSLSHPGKSLSQSLFLSFCLYLSLELFLLYCFDSFLLIRLSDGGGVWGGGFCREETEVVRGRVWFVELFFKIVSVFESVFLAPIPINVSGFRLY